VWTTAPRVGPDAISYLDLADAFLRGDLRQAVNTLWSPLYPLLLALMLGGLRPAPYWEYGGILLLNLLIYVAALASFDFLLRHLLGYQRRWAIDGSPDGRRPLPEWAVVTIGYAIFLSTSLDLIQVDRASPDMLVATSVYLSAGLVLRAAVHPEGRWTFTLLGGSLGLGYLAKAPMFILAFVFLGSAARQAYRSRPRRDAARRVLAAVAAFALIAGALAVTYRATRGRLTLGDSGRLNYAWLINGLPFAHWQGQPPRFGTPTHPTRKVLAAPPVFAFGSPVGGTYPPWFDPAYWYDGVRPRIDLPAHAWAVVRNLRQVLYDIVARRQIALLAAAAALAYLGRRRWRLWRDLRGYQILVVPGVAALGMYSLIRVEDRFVAPFLTLLWLGVFAALTVPASNDARRGGEAIALAAVVGLLLPGVGAHALGFVAQPRFAAGLHTDWEIAEGLRAAGIRSGDRIAVVGFSLGAYWARLADVKIVAEICAERPRPPWICAGERSGMRDFWRASGEVKQQVYVAFRAAGARVVVAGSVGDVNLEATPPPDDWVRVPGTGYYVYFLDR
jgi:hypothetical protein